MTIKDLVKALLLTTKNRAFRLDTRILIEDRAGLTFEIREVEDRIVDGDAEGIRAIVIVAGEKAR